MLLLNSCLPLDIALERLCWLSDSTGVVKLEHRFGAILDGCLHGAMELCRTSDAFESFLMPLAAL